LHPGKEIVVLAVEVKVQILGELGSGGKLFCIAPRRDSDNGLGRFLDHLDRSPLQ
jgi:hypothetical protein